MAYEAAQYVTVALERALRRASAGFREHCRHGARETHADKRRAEVCLAHIPISNRLSGSLAHTPASCVSVNASSPASS
jgi:hypothetical protein